VKYGRIVVVFRAFAGRQLDVGDAILVILGNVFFDTVRGLFGEKQVVVAQYKVDNLLVLRGRVFGYQLYNFANHDKRLTGLFRLTNQLKIQPFIVVM